jgi:hypothetical protein
MTSAPATSSGRLRLAVVLSCTEDECETFAAGRRTVLPFSPAFPRPRADRVAPGHLVAVSTATDGSPAVVWRWFDAVVVHAQDGSVRLWEPGHGTFLGVPRDPARAYRPGSRAYTSAGLPGAQWWVAGPVVDRPEDADVELDEVERFLTAHGL